MKQVTLLLLAVGCLLMPGKGRAQEFLISGRTLDIHGEPLPFTTIRVGETALGASSDAEGNYKLRLPAGRHVLTATLVGYLPATRTVEGSGEQRLDFVLRADTIRLQEATVRGKSQARQLREGTYQVSTLDVRSAASRTTDLGTLVNRTAGVRLRLEGGLGSDADLSLNGMSGNAIRYFIDEIPLDIQGEGTTLTHLPVGTIERIEVYKGVVPPHLGSDAMGGAIHIVTRKEKQNYLDASYSIGSFHTHVADVNGLYIFPRTGIIVKPSLGIKYSKNDYTMRDMELWDAAAGAYLPRDVKRFHDDYFSLSAEAEVGIEHRSWADAFYLSGGYHQTDKDLQSGSIQTIVYGMAERQEKAGNIAVRYSKRDFLTPGLGVNILLSHTWDKSVTIDTAYRKYSWDGTYIHTSRNEITGGARQRRHYDRPLTIARLNADYRIGGKHHLNFNYLLHRSGNRRYDDLDEEFVPSDDVLAKHIFGLSYNRTWLDGRLAGNLFAKDYLNHVKAGQKDLSWITNSDEVPEKTTKHYAGYGAGIRYAFGEWLAVTASYERAVRLPLAKELLGNGVTIYANLALQPEKSHNANAGIYGEAAWGGRHNLSYEANAFFRKTEDYIRAVLSESDGTIQYRNESDVTTRGAEGRIGYRYGDLLSLSANATYENARDMDPLNEEGKPSVTYKNKIPNKPWLFANAEASLALPDLPCRESQLGISYFYQYVHWFFLTWEGYGSLDSKARIPTQHLHSVAVTYTWGKDRYHIALGCDNLFDSKLYDNFMMQKPGRSFHCKLRVYIHK